jgi:dTMP kinase
LSDQTSERRENSVLIALKELRGMEDARVKREQDETRARLEAERAAKEMVARQAREQEEARKLAEEDKVRRVEEEKQSRLREDKVRLEEAERRARVEGEMKLQEERMRLEIQSRAHHRSPVKAVIVAVAGVALIGGVLLYRLNSQRQAEQAAAAHERQVERQVSEEKAKLREAEFVKQLDMIKRDMDDKMKTAKNEAERAKIRADAEAKKADAEQRVGSARGSGRKSGGSDSSQPSGTKAPKYKDPGKRDINDDILNGL